MGKFQATVFVCDVCQEKFLEKINKCSKCGKDICKDHTEKYDLLMKHNGNITYEQSYNICPECSKNKDEMKKFLFSYIGKDPGNLQFSD